MPEDIRVILRRTAAHFTPYDPSDVERRGLRLRHNRQWAGVAAAGFFVLVILVLSVSTIQGAWRAPADQIAAETSSSAPTTTAPTARKFVPATRLDGDAVVMAVTFIDGTTAEIVYPPSLGLAEMGAVPYGSGMLNEPPLFCCSRDFAFGYGEPFYLAESGNPVKEYPARHGGTVPLLAGPPGSPSYLVFTIGEWRLGVWDVASDTMSDESRALWSANLDGRVSPDGFPILEASAPVTLATVGDVHGPALGFAGAENNSVRFRPTTECPPNYVEPKIDEIAGEYLSFILCRPQWAMQINITGNREFAQQIVSDVQVRGVRLGGN